MKFSVIKTGGKQYLVKADEELLVDRLAAKANEAVEFDCLAEFDTEKGSIDLGMPLMKQKVKAKVIEEFKGDKVRVARFKAKTRYRRVKGFRHSLTKVKILTI